MDSGAQSSRQIGPYVILDRIGDGGMAEIFLAKMEGFSGFEKLVALKKILPRYSENEAFAQMLIHEAKLAARLTHFNVVQVLDLGSIEGQVYIAMEYVRGRDLAALLSNTYRRKETLPVPISLFIGTEFLTGLDYAHRLQDAAGKQMNLIHRDISPQNILISSEGEVKVTDFGIARVYSEGQSFELPGNLHGKFGYMSPEQVQGKVLDQRSDIFSAGVVLYEMLTGRRLYRGKDPKATIEMILSRDIAPPSTKNPEVTHAVDRVVMRALHKNREDRYQTVGSLLGDLSRVADGLEKRAQRRDLAVYMRRQFGSTERARSSDRLKKEPHGVAQVSGYSPTAAGRTPLGELLIGVGKLSPADLDIALAEQRARGGRSGEILVQGGLVSEADVVAALSQQTGIPVAAEAQILARPPEPSLLARFPRELATTMHILPLVLQEEKRSAVLAVADPFDERALLEAKVVLGVSAVTVYLAGTHALARAISAVYPAEPISLDQADELILDIVDEEPPTPLVLLADSNPALLDELAERIRAEEYEVIAVSDGKKARDACREQNPLVAFIEANLPGIDGYNILLDLRSRGSDAAVFITAARADSFHQSKAMDLGADDFLVKPFNVEVISAKIRREVQKRVAGRAVGPPPTNFAGVSGSLEDMSLLDIVQGLELGRKTAVVDVQYEDGRAGELGVITGDIKFVRADTVAGEEAFYELARPGAGRFRIEYRPPTETPNLSRPNTFLILEALRLYDEQTAGIGREVVADDGRDPLAGLADDPALFDEPKMPPARTTPPVPPPNTLADPNARTEPPRRFGGLPSPPPQVNLQRLEPIETAPAPTRPAPVEGPRLDKLEPLADDDLHSSSMFVWAPTIGSSAPPASRAAAPSEGNDTLITPLGVEDGLLGLDAFLAAKPAPPAAVANTPAGAHLARVAVQRVAVGADPDRPEPAFTGASEERVRHQVSAPPPAQKRSVMSPLPAPTPAAVPTFPNLKPPPGPPPGPLPALPGDPKRNGG